MRAAMCLYGIVGGTDGKDGVGEPIPFEKCYDSYKKHIIDINNTDVFIHSWSCEVKDELIKLYKPKKHLFEKQKQFKKEIKPFTYRPGASWRSLSKWYSFREASKLRKEYEIENNFKYDWVMFTRFDTIFFVDMNFSKYDLGYLYVPNFNTFMGMPGKPHVKADRINKSKKQKRFLDMWYLGSSEIADVFMDIYRGIVTQEYRWSQHQAAWDCLIKHGYNPKEFRYILYKYFDYDLYRWKFLKNFYKKGDGKI